MPEAALNESLILEARRLVGRCAVFSRVAHFRLNQGVSIGAPPMLGVEYRILQPA